MPRNRSKKWRLQPRRRGRFQRSTLANTHGLTAWVCAACRGFNPVDLGEPKPESCCQCGATPFVDLAEDANDEG